MRVDFCIFRFIRVVVLRVVCGCVMMVNCDVRVKWKVRYGGLGW